MDHNRPDCLLCEDRSRALESVETMRKIHSGSHVLVSVVDLRRTLCGSTFNPANNWKIEESSFLPSITRLIDLIAGQDSPDGY